MRLKDEIWEKDSFLERRIKDVATIVNGYPFDSERFSNDYGFPLIRIRDITAGFCETYYDGEDHPEVAVNDGDLLIGMDGDFNVRWWMGGRALLNQRCCMIRENDQIDRRFLYYILPFHLKRINEFANSTTVKHLSSGDILNTRCRFPSLAIQRKIVSYLDEKTAAIDERVAVLEKKLAAYKRLKTSVINRAVTRGLDPNAKLKDSGVDWIGKVPVGWATRRVKDEGIAWNGLTYSPEDVCEEGNGVLVLRSSNIQDGKLCFEDNVYVDRSLAQAARVRSGDILICSRNGSRALVGKNALISEDVNAAFGAFMLVFRGGSEIDTRYAYYVFNAQMFESYMGGFATSTINQLLRSDFLNMEMPHPPLSEQRAIADYLDAECAKIDKMAALVTQEIELYKNLKRSLINEVVTGKREVA